MNHKDWKHSKYSVICADHFEEKFIKYGKKCKLRWELHPVPTINSNLNDKTSLLKTPTISWLSPTKRYFNKDELEDYEKHDTVVDLDSFTKDHAPNQFTFVKQENRVQYYNLMFDKDTGIPSVHKCITVNETLHVVLSYKGIRIPLPEWFRHGHNCQVTRFSMMENFLPLFRNRTNDINTILQELTLRQYYKPQARPPFSANLIHFALHLCYTSCQAYKLLLEKLPLPSLGLLQKISQGNVDSRKALNCCWVRVQYQMIV